jgi:hypothetical protein
MQLAILVTILLALCLVLCAASPSTRQDGPPPPSLPPELKRLEAYVGTWDAEVSIAGQTMRGSETCRLECGGHWLVTEHTGSLFGAPFQGKGLTGYDAARGAYSGVWVDSTGGPMSVYANGRFSADGKEFRSEVDGVGQDGKPARLEYLSKFPDARTRTFEIFQVEGKERELQMSIRYTKRG